MSFFLFSSEYLENSVIFYADGNRLINTAMTVNRRQSEADPISCDYVVLLLSVIFSNVYLLKPQIYIFLYNYLIVTTLASLILP